MSVYLFLFYHKLNRLDGRIFSVVLVVSHLIALMIKLVQSLHTRGVGGGSTLFLRLICGHTGDTSVVWISRCTYRL